MSKPRHIPWLSEPNTDDFHHRSLLCAIRRTPALHLRGYVRIPKGHPWHNQDRCEREAEVHGGITHHGPGAGMYSAELFDAEGETWIGFDCGHSGDVSPGSTFENERGVYRTWAYVEEEVCDLADQVSRVLEREKALTVAQVLGNVEDALGPIQAEILRAALGRG